MTRYKALYSNYKIKNMKKKAKGLAKASGSSQKGEVSGAVKKKEQNHFSSQAIPPKEQVYGFV